MDFSGGLGNLSVDLRHMQGNEAYVALNADIVTVLGALKAVRDNKTIGTITGGQPLDSIHKFLTSLLLHSGGQLYYGGSFSIDSQAFSSENPMSAVNYRGTVYVANGNAFLKSVDGRTWSTPFVRAPSITGVTIAEHADPGVIPAGTYRYKQTYVQETTALQKLHRDESPPSALVEITTVTADKKITLDNLPSSTGYNLLLYRNELGSAEWREVVEITDGSTSYTDNFRFADLGEILTTELYETPPIPKIIKKFNNNLFLMGIQSWQGLSLSILDNFAFYSDDMRFSAYSPLFRFDVGSTDDKLMNGEVGGDNFYFYTKAGITMVTGVNAREYRQRSTHAFTGLAATWALVNTVGYGHLLLCSDRKLRIFNGFSYLQNEDLRKMDALFEENSSYPYAMNWTQREKCRLMFFNQTAYLAYPSGSNTENDKVLKMDFRYFPRIRFTIDDYPVSAWYADQINHLLYLGNASGEVREAGKASTYLPVTWKGKDWDGGDIHALKTYGKGRIDYDSKGKDIALTLTVDDQANNVITLNKDGRHLRDKPFRSFSSPGQGYRAAMQFKWDEPDKDIVVYDAELSVSKEKKT